MCCASNLLKPWSQICWNPGLKNLVPSLKQGFDARCYFPLPFSTLDPMGRGTQSQRGCLLPQRPTNVCCMLKASKINQGWGHIKYDKYGSLNNIMDNNIMIFLYIINYNEIYWWCYISVFLFEFIDDYGYGGSQEPHPQISGALFCNQTWQLKILVSMRFIYIIYIIYILYILYRYLYIYGLPGLVNIQKAIENGPVEIVDLPITNGDFPQLCKRLPKGSWENQWTQWFLTSHRFVKKNARATWILLRSFVAYSYPHCWLKPTSLVAHDTMTLVNRWAVSCFCIMIPMAQVGSFHEISPSKILVFFIKWNYLRTLFVQFFFFTIPIFQSSHLHVHCVLSVILRAIDLLHRRRYQRCVLRVQPSHVQQPAEALLHGERGNWVLLATTVIWMWFKMLMLI